MGWRCPESLRPQIFLDGPCSRFSLGPCRISSRDSEKQESQLSLGLSLGHSLLLSPLPPLLPSPLPLLLPCFPCLPFTPSPLLETSFGFPQDSWSSPQILLISGQDDGSGTWDFPWKSLSPPSHFPGDHEMLTRSPVPWVDRQRG